jgi:hypothetical protein
MSRTRFITHREKKILLMDFSYIEPNDVQAAIEQARDIIAVQPPASVLGLLDVTGSPFNKKIVTLPKQFARHNAPYIKTTVVVGVEEIKGVIFNAVLMFTGRKNIVLRNSLEEAKNWLAEQ